MFMSGYIKSVKIMLESYWMFPNPLYRIETRKDILDACMGLMYHKYKISLALAAVSSTIFKTPSEITKGYYKSDFYRYWNTLNECREEITTQQYYSKGPSHKSTFKAHSKVKKKADAASSLLNKSKTMGSLGEGAQEDACKAFKRPRYIMKVADLEGCGVQVKGKKKKVMFAEETPKSQQAPEKEQMEYLTADKSGRPLVSQDLAKVLNSLGTRASRIHTSVGAFLKASR